MKTETDLPVATAQAVQEAANRLNDEALKYRVVAHIARSSLPKNKQKKFNDLAAQHLVRYHNADTDFTKALKDAGLE